MMPQVPFLYVNILAFCCFLLMFLAFMCAKKSSAIWAFIAVMLDCILWSGGSILMRLLVWPGREFWYYVSLVALFSMELLFYIFVHTFYHQKGKLALLLCFIGTIAIIPGTVSGFFLMPPTPSYLADGSLVFTYSLNWHILIPCTLFVAIILATAALFVRLLRERGTHSPGLIVILSGGCVMLLGNLLQCGIPGNTFPYDALAGVFFAFLLMWALYKKRLFQMSLLISRSLLIIVAVAMCVITAVYFVGPMQSFFMRNYGMGSTAATTIIVIIFAASLSLVYIFIKKLFDALFIREEEQNRILQDFSSAVSQSLNTGDIMEKLIAILKRVIPVRCVYVCLPQDGSFAALYSSERLAPKDFIIHSDSPCVKYLKRHEQYLIVSEFKKDPLYLSVWQDEKDVIRDHSVACITALKDGEDIVGLIMLSEKEKNAQYTYKELSFLETVSSIASIAVKNAGLYEQMYREARVDSLTGVYNYRFFVERINAEFELCRDDCLALLYVDVDDFKLYNQLYGSIEGDKALRTVAEIITLCAGSSGTVFRYSGKVFAVLLPHRDARQTEQLALEIRRRVTLINAVPGRQNFKPLSISCGICVSPYAASSAKELLDNADLAVYNAKESGKDRINIFKGASTACTRVSDKAMRIVENNANLNAAYQANNSTIAALTAAIDAKDHYTYKHSRNVALYSAILATAAGLNDNQITMIYEAALLHDIGKISIPETILSKNGTLSSDEFSLMKNHVNNAIDMIKHLPSMDYVIPAAIGHHERWDGKGYPRGLSGQEIPLSARCLAIADAFDAMTTDRPYRKGLAPDYAAEQIEQNAGKQFDPDLAIIFVNLIHDGELDCILHRV